MIDASAPVETFEEIDSTMLEARRRAERGELGPVWLVARRQTAGRGRRGRTWITKDDYLQLRTEFYDEEKALINVLELSQIEEMGDRTIPTLLEMIPVEEKGQKTVIEYHSIEFDEPIPESFFSEQNMKRVR